MSADIIPFPTPSHSVKADDDVLYTEADLDALAEWTATDGPDPGERLSPAGGSADEEPLDDDLAMPEWTVDDDGVFEFPEPSDFVEADGKWVWLPEAEDPTDDVPVGMVGHQVKTMCRWQWRHHADGLTAPQKCCYSVLITTARLPGEARTERHWLAEAE